MTTDFVLAFDTDRVLIFDQTGKVLLACVIRGEATLEREKKIVELAAQLYAECYGVDVVNMEGPFVKSPGALS